MIRINLLPVRKVKKAQAGRRQLVLLIAGLLAEVALMVFLYESKQSEAEERQRQVTQIESEIEQLKREVGDFDKLKAQFDLLTAQQKVIGDLQRARTGPALMLRELSDILTPGKGPTVNQARYEQIVRRNPSSGYSLRWNPHRLWLDGITDRGGLLQITGKAKDFDDVAEFNKRLSLSELFSDDFLERNDAATDSEHAIRVVKFQLRCRARY